MAWEELLKLHERPEDSLSPAVSQETKEKSSLIQQAAAMIGLPEDPAVLWDASDAPVEEPVQYSDGYVRRSPVQPYLTAADFEKRRLRKLLIALVVIALVVALAASLMRAGILRLR